jgi:hypothetical protein
MPLVEVWIMVPLFVHTTGSPTLIVKLAGLKELPTNCTVCLVSLPGGVSSGVGCTSSSLLLQPKNKRKEKFKQKINRIFILKKIYK